MLESEIERKTQPETDRKKENHEGVTIRQTHRAAIMMAQHF
jgi:hypothetical protein